MSKTALIGLVLALLGGAALYFGGFSYPTDEASIDFGPIQARAVTEERVNIPPLAAGAVLVAGIGLLTVAATRKA